MSDTRCAMMATQQTSASVVTAGQGIGRKTLQDTIKEIETQIALLGPGPHTVKQQEDLSKLKELHGRALAEQEKATTIDSATTTASTCVCAGHSNPAAATNFPNAPQRTQLQPQLQPQMQQMQQMQPQMTVVQHSQPHIMTTQSTGTVQMVNIIKPPMVTTQATLPVVCTSAPQQLNTGLVNATASPVTIPRPITVQGGTTVPQPGTPGRISPEGNQILTKRRLHDLVKEVDPNEQLDEDVEELLLQIADDFIENVVTSACQLAKHRKSSTVEVKDVQLHLGKCLYVFHTVIP
uniref:Transcription initiation factor TFIID subunit 12 n=1 Tax=Saccoglossus kowalevskii TaxID=10224 RepID=A0ABM0MQS6_SACKO|nr:PREDICTED: transcription initiation factor TFIID subunit 12-like [Saccoglossus kowalevskii]